MGIQAYDHLVVRVADLEEGIKNLPRHFGVGIGPH